MVPARCQLSGRCTLTAGMPPCWASIRVRLTKRSPAAVTGFEESVTTGAGFDSASGAKTCAPAVAGEPAAPGVAPAFDLGGRPAAALQPSESESLFSLRHAITRPPPCGPVPQNF